MVTKVPNSKFKRSSASSPKAPQRQRPKPAHSRDFLAPPGGERFPLHFPPRGGPFPGVQRTILSPPESVHGPLAGKLGRPLDINQVAEMIGCSPWTVRQTLIPRGLPHFRFKASGRLTFYEGQVIRWIERQQEGGTTTK
jgi:hypothetical protein